MKTRWAFTVVVDGGAMDASSAVGAEARVVAVAGVIARLDGSCLEQVVRRAAEIPVRMV